MYSYLAENMYSYSNTHIELYYRCDGSMLLVMGGTPVNTYACCLTDGRVFLYVFMVNLRFFE